MMERSHRYRVSAEWRPESLSAAITGKHTVEILPAEDVAHTYLDTFDWRVAGAGGRLIFETLGRLKRLLWFDRDAGSRSYQVPVRRIPRWRTDLPQGLVRERLHTALDVRALLIVGETRVRRQRVRVLDREGNSVLRMVWEVVEVVGSDPGTEPIHALRVEALPGQDKLLSKVESALSGSVVDTLAATDLRAAAAVAGRSPGDYSSKLRLDLNRGEPAASAVRTILLELLHTLRVNVPGVKADHDVEFLHDFRVACRRSRSALTQLRTVLNRQEVEPYLAGFKWLGTVTGPCRDLDVYLLEMEDFREMLPAQSASALAPLEQRIRRDRVAAQRAVAEAIDSTRFTELVEGWDRYLRPSDAGFAGVESGYSVEELAGRRVLKAYRRMLERGAKLGPDPAAESLHRLRIDAKKLRYLLEFFRSLYPRKRVDRLVKELKRLQDILGGFNDAEVQQRRLRELARGDSGGGRLPVDTLLALGRLEAALEERQESCRSVFHERFEAFADHSSRAEYAALFGVEV